MGAKPSTANGGTQSPRTRAFSTCLCLDCHFFGMDMSNDRQRARSLSSVPDLHASHETISMPAMGASFDVSTGASPETDSSSAEEAAGMLNSAAANIALGSVYAAHSLFSHIWSLNVSMSSSSTISYLRDFLVDFGYPSGALLDESAFADVFLKSNRRFLLAWTMWVYESGAEGVEAETGPPEWDDGLPGRLVEMGLIDDVDMVGFVRGEMDPKTELQIFRNMFEFVRISKTPAPEFYSPPVSKPIDEYFRKTEPPLCGNFPIPEKSTNKTITTITVPKIQIDMIQKPDTTIGDRLFQVESEVRHLAASRSELAKLRMLDSKETTQISFPSDFPKIVANCKRNLEEFYQYVNDMKIIEKFLEGPTDVTFTSPNDAESRLLCSGPMDAAVTFLERVAAKLAAIKEIQRKLNTC